MPKLIIPMAAVAASLLGASAFAQQIEGKPILTDAKPGECYAKVLMPARFETRSEEMIVQEAAERIEIQPAVYDTVSKEIVTREASKQILVTPTTFSFEEEPVETRAAERLWRVGSGDQTLPASPDVMKQLEKSGIDPATVSPGNCFVEYVTEAQYRAEPTRVMVREATESITVVPARFETVAERILIKEAAVEIIEVPAVYRTVTESVLVEPTRRVWQEDCGAMEQLDNATGDTLCLVELPARFEVLTKVVLVSPATTRRVEIPAEYRTIQVERLVSPAREERIEVPAEYTMIDRQVKVADAEFFWQAKGEAAADSAVATGREVCLTQQAAEQIVMRREVVSAPPSVTVVDTPAELTLVEVQTLREQATERRINIPARTRTVSSRVEVEPARVEWKPVLCRMNMTRETITKLQQALEREGYDPGPIDGIVGQGTLRAIDQYQTSEGIDRGGITLQSLMRLGVESQ